MKRTKASALWIVTLCCVAGCDTVIDYTPVNGQALRVEDQPEDNKRLSEFWSPTTSTGGRLLSMKDDRLSRLTFACEDKFLVAGGDGRLLIWRTADWRRLSDVEINFQVFALVGVPHSSHVAAGGENGELHIIDVASQREEVELIGHRDTVTCVACSPDGKKLASGGFDGMVRVWDLSQPQKPRVISLNSKTVFALGFSPDGATLGIRTQGELLVVWDVRRDSELFRIDKQGLNARTVAFSPDGNRFATAQNGKAVVIRETSTGREVSSIEAGWPEVFWHPRQRPICVLAQDHVIFCDPLTGEIHQKVRIADGWIQSLAISDSGCWMSTVDNHSKVLVRQLSKTGVIDGIIQPTIPKAASVDGRYFDLLRILPAPDDAQTLGAFHEAGYRKEEVHPEFGAIPSGFRVYAEPNWYVFEYSQIGLHHPPAKIPQPMKLSNGRSRIWLVTPWVT